MIDVTVVLVEGGMPSTAVAPVEVFSSTGVLWNTMRGEPVDPPFHVRTASRNGDRVRTAVCLELQATCRLDEVDTTDIVIVSAVGADIDTAAPANADLYPWLCERYDAGATIAGVCAGAALVAEAGLLDGCMATTHWGVAEACRRRYPRVRWRPERFITESGRIVCSGGVYAAVDLSLYLVEKFCGHQRATETARALLLDTPRMWQVGYAAEPPDPAHDDGPVRAVQDWLFHNFTRDIRVEALAEKAGMSPRTFNRRFRHATGESPLNYLHRLRINVARHLLESDLKSVLEVSQAVGYDDLAFFRRLFRRYTGCSPRAYRERFGVSAPATVALAGRVPHR